MRHTYTCTHHRFPTSMIVPFWREKEQQLGFFPRKTQRWEFICLSCPQKRRSKRYVVVLYASYRLQHKPSGPKLVAIVIHVVCTPLGEDPLPARKKRKKGSKLFLHVAFLWRRQKHCYFGLKVCQGPKRERQRVALYIETSQITYRAATRLYEKMEKRLSKFSNCCSVVKSSIPLGIDMRVRKFDHNLTTKLKKNLTKSKLKSLYTT